MSRIVVAFSVCCFAILGFVSMAAAAPFATDRAVQVSPRDLVVQVDFKCRKVDGKLVCGSTKGNKNRDDDDDDDNDDDDKPKKSKDKVIPKTCGKKVNCEAGFVKLEKPNSTAPAARHEKVCRRPSSKHLKSASSLVRSTRRTANALRAPSSWVTRAVARS